MKVWRGNWIEPSKDSPSSNAGIDLVLEKQRETIAGLVIKDVFVLPSEF
jgi:hypothetical protein